MAEHNEVDLELQSRRSTMKKEKLKSKFVNSAMAKVRSFFRSFELKDRHRHTSFSSPSSNEDHPKKDLVLNSISPTTHLSISQIPRVDKINPRDLIVHRIVDTDDQLHRNYFQQKYKQYFKPSLLLPKQYYNELLNKQNYSTFVNKHDFHSPPATTLSPNFRYLPSHNDLSFSSYRSFISHETKSPSNELLLSPLPLQPSSSMSTWNQCVRRLNTEYRLTLDALEQAKECLKQVYSDSKYPLDQNLSINETKKSAIVTFYLPSPTSALSTFENSIEQHKMLPSVLFGKPKLIKPVELETFISSLNLESELSIDEIEKESNSPLVISRLDDKPPSIAPDPLIFQEEETTYTIETFYLNIDHQKRDFSPPIAEHVVVVQENSTEEQFNRAQQHTETNSSVLPKPAKKSMSRIPTVSRLKQPTKIKPPSTSIIHHTARKSIGGTNKAQLQMTKQPSINKSDPPTRVKSIVQPSITNKRITRTTTVRRNS